MTWYEVCLRAGGRRRYNCRRRQLQFIRRHKVYQLVCELELFFVHGAAARIARELGVSRSTVSRDLQWLEQGQPKSATGRRITIPRKWRIR